MNVVDIHIGQSPDRSQPGHGQGKEIPGCVRNNTSNDTSCVLRMSEIGMSGLFGFHSPFCHGICGAIGAYGDTSLFDRYTCEGLFQEYLRKGSLRSCIIGNTAVSRLREYGGYSVAVFRRLHCMRTVSLHCRIYGRTIGQ